MAEPIGNGFVYQVQKSRVLFGSGMLSALNEEVEKLGITKALVVSTPQQEATGSDIGAKLGPLFAGLCARAQMHTPIHVTEQALGELKNSGADGIVSVGGGSTIGLGKALSVRTGLPHLAIPTTYAGSEVTPILGETTQGQKTTRRDPSILPQCVIYDVDLSRNLPVNMSVTSGINAIAHAVEALYAPDNNPIVFIMAERAIELMAKGLKRVLSHPTDHEARRNCLEAAWLAGSCLGMVGMGIHHKLCHTLGGAFDLPHSETHTIILPYATRYVSDGAPEAMQAICRALGEKDAAQGLRNLCEGLNAPTSLQAIGMPENVIGHAADLALKNPYWCPRPLEREAIEDLLTRAYFGRPLKG